MPTLPLADPKIEEEEVKKAYNRPTRVDVDEAGEYVRIAIGFNRWIKVDPDDYSRVRKLRWYMRIVSHVSRRTENKIEKLNVYTVVMKKGRRHNLPLSRFIMKTDEKTRVRFRSTDRLDFRKSNLWAGGHRALAQLLDDLPIEEWLEMTEKGEIENAGVNAEYLQDVQVLDDSDEWEGDSE